MTTEQYRHERDHFLEQAREEPAGGERPQASEKGWGVAAQVLKVIAEQRGWAHHRHRHYHGMANRLRSEIGDSEIRGFFNSASALRKNFYQNDMDADPVGESLDDVAALLAKLTLLLTQTGVAI